MCAFCRHVSQSRTARDLRVVIDSQLSPSAHVAAVCRSGYYQLRQLRPAFRSMSEDASKTLVQAFVSCRLDYCNSLLFGICDGLLRQLQSVQNAATHVGTGTRHCDHIMPVLHHYTGYWYANASISGLPHFFICCCPETLHHI